MIRGHGYEPESRLYRKDNGLRTLVRSGTNIFGEPCAVLMRRSALERAGLFKGSYLIDLDMWLRLWDLGPAVFNPSTLAQFRISRTSWTSALKGKQSSLMRELILQIQSDNPTLISYSDVKTGIRHSASLERRRAMVTSLIEISRL